MVINYNSNFGYYIILQVHSYYTLIIVNYLFTYCCITFDVSNYLIVVRFPLILVGTHKIIKSFIILIGPSSFIILECL